MLEPKKRPQATYAKVAENLYRLESSGTYYALLKRSGKQIRKSLKTTDRKLAKRRLDALRERVDRTSPVAGNVKITFKEMGERWLKTVKPHLKQSTYRRRESSLNNLNRTFGIHNLRSITKRMCEDWATKRGPTCKASTFNIDRETLTAVLQYAQGEGIILDNPAHAVKKRKRGKTELRIPTLDHLQKILKHLRGLDIRYQRTADLIELLAWSGMRKGEANAFLWQDIDWDRGLFTVTGGEVGTKNHEVRTVPMFPAFREFLEAQKGRVGEVFDDVPVVPNQSGKKGLEKACRDLDLPRYNHHSMRHFFVSMAIEKNIDFKTIAAWVGHKDGGVLVAQTYGHLRDTHSMEMAKLMKVGS